MMVIESLSQRVESDEAMHARAILAAGDPCHDVDLLFDALGSLNSNLGAPTNKIKGLTEIFGFKSSQKLALGRPWEDARGHRFLRTPTRELSAPAATPKAARGYLESCSTHVQKAEVQRDCYADDGCQDG